MINLSKGGRINISKDENGNTLTKIFFGVNWGAIEKGGFLGFGKTHEAVDLDASAIMMAGEVDIETIYFGHKNSSDGAIKHSGDDLVGDIGGDDGKDNEVISVDLSKIRPSVDKVVFILNSYRHHKFDQIPYMGIHIFTGSINNPVNLAKYNLKNDSNDPDTTFVGKEGMILGYAYRKDGEWKFKALGNTGTWTSISNIIRAIPQYL